MSEDIELEFAIKAVIQTPNQVQQFVQSKQDKVFKDVTSLKDVAFQKVYGDLSYATNEKKAELLNNMENMDIIKSNEEIYKNQKNNTDSILQNKELLNRKYEMNEWTVNNKKDTLFVFSMLFVVISALLLITGLFRMGIISTTVWVAISVIVLLVFIFTVVYRSQYTDIYRNKRYWNRKIFEGKYGKIPFPSIPFCPGAFDEIQNSVNNLNRDIRNNIASATISAAQGAQSAAQQAQVAAQQAQVAVQAQVATQAQNAQKV